MNLSRIVWMSLVTASASLEASQPAGSDSGIRWTSEPISAELGLVDVAVDPTPGTSEGFELAFDNRGAASETERVVLHKTGDPKEQRWHARLMHNPAAGDAGCISFWLREAGRPEGAWQGPFRAPTGSAQGPPAWALGAVWYQVFPERFSNGNPRNDPTGPGVFRRGWGQAWEEVTPAEVEAAWARAEGQPDVYRYDVRQAGSALYGVATARRYGGDLEGLCARLDSLRDLGVTAVYLNPVFDAPSMHKYDAADYRHIDPTFAGDDPAERPEGETLDPATWRWTDADRYLIDTLLPAARARGIRIILDGVWNHTSTRFWAFADIARHGPASPYVGWYDVQFTEGRLTGWQGWNGWNGGLPQFARGADGNIVAPVRAHIADITRRWMDPNGDGDPSDGIDGWRLDVAKDIPTAFWREWCPLVRSINPNAIMIGEVWFADHERVGDGLLDAQMNYPFAMAAVRWLDGRPGFGSRELGAALNAALGQTERINLAQMNLLDSHDTARVATMLNNPGRGYGGNEKPGRGAPGYRTARPGPDVYKRVVLGAALQATWPGSPMVYAGDEWGEFGADDPDDRKPVPWPDLGPYQDGDEAPDATVRDRYREWMRLRGDPVVGPVLRYGSVEPVDTGSAEVFGFVRELNATRVFIVLNRGDTAIDAAGVLTGLGQDTLVGGLSARWWLLGNP